MNADKLLQSLMKIDPKTFKRVSWIGQLQNLNKFLDHWESMAKKSPRQSHIWKRRYWELVESSCDSLSDLMRISDNVTAHHIAELVKKFNKLFYKLHYFDEDQLHKVMLNHPRAFAHMEEEWAAWTKLAI